MTNLKIRIGAVGDPPLFPEFDGAQSAELAGFGILEKATARGRTGVAFMIKTADGKHFCVETTARMLVNGMASATRGACQRFGDDLNEP